MSGSQGSAATAPSDGARQGLGQTSDGLNTWAVSVQLPPAATEEPPRQQAASTHACVVCGTTAGSEACCTAHRGVWHSAFADCSARCAWGLGPRRLGEQHWSCCFATDRAAPCPETAHVFAPEDVPASEAAPIGALFDKSDCPRYVVDLDAPPEQRWAHVVRDFAEQLPGVLSLADDILGELGCKIVEPLLSAAARVGFVQYGQELRGVAEATGVPLGKVVMLQIAYEAFAACTSIVVNGEEGPLHIRTMDWEMPQLQPLTVEINFLRAGKVVLKATTWAGYIGVLTGVRPGGFSISVNYRRSEQMVEDPLRAFMTNLQRGVARHWPVSFLVRETFDRCESYEQACATLQQSELVAPTYLTIAGVKPGEGMILNRDRNGVHDGSCISGVLARDGPLVQANMDCFRSDNYSEEHAWQDICQSRLRRGFALRAFAACQSAQGTISLEDLWRLMSLPPCLAHDTVYTVSMVPHTGELITRVHATRAQKREGRKRFGTVRAPRVDGAGAATRQ